LQDLRIGKLFEIIVDYPERSVIFPYMVLWDLIGTDNPNTVFALIYFLCSWSLAYTDFGDLIDEITFATSSRQHFFLEYTGELCIIVLIEESWSHTERPPHTLTHTQAARWINRLLYRNDHLRQKYPNQHP
jgi:hypothetical protein